jgi:hypothetical protein
MLRKQMLFFIVMAFAGSVAGWSLAGSGTTVKDPVVITSDLIAEYVATGGDSVLIAQIFIEDTSKENCLVVVKYQTQVEVRKGAGKPRYCAPWDVLPDVTGWYSHKVWGKEGPTLAGFSKWLSGKGRR